MVKSELAVPVCVSGVWDFTYFPVKRKNDSLPSTIVHDNVLYTPAMFSTGTRRKRGEGGRYRRSRYRRLVRFFPPARFGPDASGSGVSINKPGMRLPPDRTTRPRARAVLPRRRFCVGTSKTVFSTYTSARWLGPQLPWRVLYFSIIQMKNRLRKTYFKITILPPSFLLPRWR